MEDRISKRIDILDEKQDRVNLRLEEKLGSIDTTLVKIQADLEYHIARTNLLETRMGVVEDSCEECPAKKTTLAYKQVLVFLRDLSIVGSLVIIVLKLFGLIDLGF